GSSADVADQVPDRGPRRIVAGVAALRHDTVQVRQSDADRRKSVVVETVGNLDRLVSGRLVDLVAQVLNLHRREPEQIAESKNRRLRILETLGNDVDAEIRAVGRKGSALAIETPAARGR